MITTCPQRYLESTFLRCHNVSLQHCDNQKAMLSQRCDNVILLAGIALIINFPVCVGGEIDMFTQRIGCRECHCRIYNLMRTYDQKYI